MLEIRTVEAIREGVELFVTEYCSEQVKGKFIRLFTSTETIEVISKFLDELLPIQHSYLVSNQEDNQLGTWKSVQVNQRPFFQHKILGLNSDTSRNVLDDQGCIDIRNEVEEKAKIGEPEFADSLNFIYLFDGSIEVTGSLGPDTFSQVDFDDVLNSLLSKKLSELDQSSKIKNLLGIAESSGSSSTGILNKILFVQRLKQKDFRIEALGRYLNEIGLIPDFGSDYLNRISQNRVAVKEIFAKSSTSTIAERLERANLVFGDFFQMLRKFLEEQNVDRDPELWKSRLPEELTFEKWPIVSKSEIELLDLSIKQFVTNDGKLDSGCFLHYDSDSGTLTALDKVKISWSTTPTIVGELGKWRVEVLPVEEIRGDFPTLRSKVVKSTARTSTITFDLSEEEKEDLAPRYQVRLTALDADGNEVNFSKKSSRSSEVALAYSQEFQIESQYNDLPDRSSAKRNVYPSIGHAVLDKTFKGSNSIQISNFSYEGDFLTGTFGNGSKVSIPISPLVVDIQNFILANPERAFLFVGTSLTGGKMGFNLLERNELEIPAALLEVRKRVLLRLSQIEGPKVPENLLEDVEFVKLCCEYLETYSESVSTSNAVVTEALLKLDTLQVSVSSIKGEINASVILPIHPMRLKWLADHYLRMISWSRLLVTELDRKRRPEKFDLSIANSITPANYPFTIFGKTSIDVGPYVYLGELIFGAGVYVEPSNKEQQFCLEVLNSVLSPHKLDIRDYSSMDSVTNKVNRYLDSHAEGKSLNLISIAPGDGTLISGILGRLMVGGTENRLKRSRVTVYSNYFNFVRPLASIQDLQETVEQLDSNQKDTFLSPSLEVRAKRIDQLGDEEFDEHIAIIEGLADSNVTYADSRSVEATSTLNGLIVRTASVSEDLAGGKRFLTFPAVTSLDAQNPDILTAAHHKYLEALVTGVGGGRHSLPVLELAIDVDKLAQLAVVHSFADWVIAVDPHIGLGIIEVILGQSLIEGFVLDYAPDFIDGVGNRITVSSSKNSELFRVLEEAMNYIGLLPRGVDAKYLLESLSLASGQLALRLLREDTKAKETIGLAVTMAYLRISGHLKNKIVIPVDSHLNLFGTHSRNVGESGERCDLILIEFSEDSYSINLVEVKARTGEPEVALPLVMESQINQTETILRDRIFENNGHNRFDSDLQWARWASLLRFYSERALLRNELDSIVYDQITAAIREIEITHKTPTIVKTGFIVSMQASKASLPRNVGEMELVLLNGEKLRDQGFTTVMHSQSKNTSDNTEIEDPIVQDLPNLNPEPKIQESIAAQIISSPPVPELGSNSVSSSPTREIRIVLGVEVEND